MGFAGPTFFNVEQQLVTDVNFVHEYPFDTATFSSAVASPGIRLDYRIHVGTDITYYFTNHVGIGWFTRYSRATLELPSVGNGNTGHQARWAAYGRGPALAVLNAAPHSEPANSFA